MADPGLAHTRMSVKTQTADTRRDTPDLTNQDLVHGEDGHEEEPDHHLRLVVLRPETRHTNSTRT
eukprot:2333869-Rhodomonas_salina.1